MATPLLCFLGLKDLFWGSLHSNLLHGLQLISFSTIPGTKCFFFVSLTFKYFYGFFAFLTTARTGADYLFGNTCNFFSVSWTKIFLWVF